MSEEDWNVQISNIVAQNGKSVFDKFETKELERWQDKKRVAPGIEPEKDSTWSEYR